MTPGRPHRTIRTRRGIHGLMEVSLLMGFAIVMAGVALAVLSDMADNAANTADCVLSEALLYRTGTGRAYFAVTVSNMGSSAMTAADITFSDDAGSRHGFRNGTLAIGPGQALKEAGPFPADITPRKAYMIDVLVSSADGSSAGCSAVHRSE